MKRPIKILRQMAAILTACTTLMGAVTIIAETEEIPMDDQNNIYVSPIGSDDAIGSIDAPLATLTRAQQIAREKGPADTTIVVREGFYFFDEPLTLTAEDAGLTIKAMEGEKVVFSGAKDLGTPAWRDYEANSNIKVAAIDKNLGIDQLFVNRKNQVLARYPNYEEGKLPLGGAATRAQIKARVANYGDPVGGYLRAIHSNGWGGNDYIITGKDANNATGLSYQWVGDNNRGSGMNDNVVIENLLEELDAPGEWYYDNGEGLLYYYPADGVDLSDCTIDAAVTTDILTVKGEDADHPVTDITLDGFTYYATKRTLFTVEEEGKEYIPLMRGDWCVVRGGAVYIENAKNVAVINSNFQSMGGNGVFIYGYNDTHRIHNNEFIDIGATAVQIVGSPKAVYEPSFWQHDLYPNLTVHKNTVTTPDKVGPKTEDYPRDITVSNNHMENLGIFEKQSCGVNMSVSSRIKVLHNTIHKSARSGLNVNDGTFGGHEIAYNDVFDCQLETTDHGQFNSWGRDRFWSVPGYNASGNNGDLLRHYTYKGLEYDITGLDAYQTVKIHDNRFHHDTKKGSTWGIDLDDGSSNYEIYNNLCLGMGIKLREGFDRKVYNNIILDGQFQIHVSYTEARDEIYGNIVVSSTPFGFAAVDENRFKLAEYAVDKNWYYNFGSSVSLPSWFNLYNQNNNYDENALINVDPAFFMPVGNDYTVQNTEAMAKIGFENFPMDQFGKPECECHSPIYAKTGPSIGSSDVLQREDWEGAIISNVDDAIMSATASSGYTGTYFETVPTTSDAYALGLRSHDIVKEVNGQKLGAKSTFLTALADIPAGKWVTLRVWRETAWVTVSFIQWHMEETQIRWDNPLVRYSGGGNNWGTNVNGADRTSLGVHYNNTDANAWLEVDFTGSQIEFLSRKFTDQGEFRVTITDRTTGQVVIEETGTCYDTQRGYGQVAYTSPLLPQGAYTLRIQKVNGQYLILDCFYVYNTTPFSPEYGNVDALQDGVTAADALLALQASTGKVQLTNDQQTVADVDGEIGVTANDALQILQYATKKITAFPIEDKE